jgi:GTP cyclohydrolase I
MQVQERLTDQIKDCIQEALEPLGVAVVLKHSTCVCKCVVSKTKFIYYHILFTGEEKQNQKGIYV